MPSRFWRNRPCFPLSVSESDFSGRLFVPLSTRPRRPLSKSASTASWSIRCSLRTMTSGARSSSSRRRRLLRLMTFRYNSFRSLVAKRPPSSGTSGRRSGGRTGMDSMIIHSGRLPLLRKASTTLSRFAAFAFFWMDRSFRMASRSSSARWSRSAPRSNCFAAPAPMSAMKVRPRIFIRSRNSLSVRPKSRFSRRSCSSVTTCPWRSVPRRTFAIEYRRGISPEVHRKSCWNECISASVNAFCRSRTRFRSTSPGSATSWSESRV